MEQNERPPGLNMLNHKRQAPRRADRNNQDTPAAKTRGKRRRLDGIEDRTVESLLADLSHSEKGKRADAVQKLGNFAVRTTLPYLIESLNDSETDVRVEAVGALGKFGEQTPIDQLIMVLQNDSNGLVRHVTASTLGQSKTRIHEIVHALVIACRHDPDDDVRATAIRALGQHRVLIPIEVLISAIRDTGEVVREAVVHELGKQQYTVNFEVLEDCLYDESPMVRQAALHSLALLSTYPFDDLVHKESAANLEKLSTHDSALGHSSLIDGERDKLDSQTFNTTRRLTYDNVEFEGIEPKDITKSGSIPIIAQALDNQWIPNSLLKAIFKGKITYKDAELYLNGLMRTEYIRSLINGEQLIVNRAFLYNNPVLFNDYLQDGQARTTFKQFLEEGTIVPFLFSEQRPDQQPAYGTHFQGFAAWQRICQEVRMQCLRFSWDDTETQQDSVLNLTHHFHDFAKNAEDGDIHRYMVDLGIDSSQENAFYNQLAEMAGFSRHYHREHRQEEYPFITRNILYQRFVTKGLNPAERVYDETKPFAGAIKQLLDLAYNGSLADAMNGYLLTPVDSPNRLTLQNWGANIKERTSITGETLINMLRNSAFTLLQEGLYLKSLGMLTLQDVQLIRKTEEWSTYINSLRQLLRQPVLFSDLAPTVYYNYAHLMQIITRLIKGRDDQRTGSMTAAWEPSIKILTKVGDATLSVLWNHEGAFYHVEGDSILSQTISPTGHAPVTVQLIIGDSSASSRAQAALFSSIEIMKGKMPNARTEWKEILRQFRANLVFQETTPSSSKSVAIPTLNEREQL